jgi:hypothetical protein
VRNSYGAFPQTWEDPNSTHPETKAKGDNDPLDVCEIGEAVGYTGQVKQVKVLGIMALLDEGETDWKVLVVDVNDPLAGKLNDIEDVERHLPGLIRATNEWFRWVVFPFSILSVLYWEGNRIVLTLRPLFQRIYKIPDGKPENQFAFSGEAKNKVSPIPPSPVFQRSPSRLLTLAFANWDPTCTEIRHRDRPRMSRSVEEAYKRKDWILCPDVRLHSVARSPTSPTDFDTLIDPDVFITCVQR